jgi:hypothetical protein
MRELNWKPGQSAELRVLGEGAGAGPAGYPSSIIEFSGKRMHLATELPAEMKLQSGAVLRLESDGQLLLGQVLTTEPGGFWMEVHHMLLDAGGLSWQKNGWQRG